MSVMRMDFETLREMDIVDYLHQLGHEPDRIRGLDYWYCSPLREESNPSFKINRRINRWYDHGIGKGGNLIDFGILYHDCSALEFLHKIDSCSFHRSMRSPRPVTGAAEPESRINVIGDRPLASPGLLLYLSQRHIPLDVAQYYCREVEYELSGRTWFGIGFKNDAGGYEIRNAYFKGSSAPKTITSMIRDFGKVSVFEGFMDFLSHQAAFSGRPEQKGNYMILNSNALFERAMPVLQKHGAVDLYFDRDKAGQELTRKALVIGNRFKDASPLYKGYKDMNEWLINDGVIIRKQLSRGIKH